MIDDVIGDFLEAVGAIDPLLRTLLAGLAMLLETSVLLGLVVPGDTVVIVAALAVETWPWWLGLIGAVVLGALAVSLARSRNTGGQHRFERENAA